MNEKTLMKFYHQKKMISIINMESITDSDYNHAKRFWYDFE